MLYFLETSRRDLAGILDSPPSPSGPRFNPAAMALVLRPLVPRSLVPRSSRLVDGRLDQPAHGTRRRVRSATCQGTGRALLRLPRGPLRAAARRAREGVCSSDGRAGSGPGESLPGRRVPPSPPPPPRARRTQRGRHQIVVSGISSAARGCAATIPCQRRGAWVVEVRAPHRPSSPHTFPAFTKPPTHLTPQPQLNGAGRGLMQQAYE